MGCKDIGIRKSEILFLSNAGIIFRKLFRMSSTRYPRVIYRVNLCEIGKVILVKKSFNYKSILTVTQLALL